MGSIKRSCDSSNEGFVRVSFCSISCILWLAVGLCGMITGGLVVCVLLRHMIWLVTKTAFLVICRTLSRFVEASAISTVNCWANLAMGVLHGIDLRMSVHIFNLLF